MKFALILCLSYMFVSSKCGLVKNFFGTVSEEMHKLTEGNVIVNTVKKVVDVKKGIITDFSNMIDPNNYVQPNNNVYVNTYTTQRYQPQYTETNDQLLTVTKPTINLNEIIPPLNTQPILGNGPLPGSIINTHKEKDRFVQTTTELYKPIIFDQDNANVHITEYGIEPRIARQVTPHTSEDVTHEQSYVFTGEPSIDLKETDFNDKTFDIVANNENESIISNFDMLVNYTGAVETVVVGGCPEGVEMAADGSCILIDVKSKNDTKIGGKNRANFVGGCFSGYAHAEDGTCQEVIYD